MNYKECSLLELCEKIIDNRGRTCPIVEVGFPLIATNCVKNSSLYPIFEKVRYVDKPTYENWFRGHPAPGDIIFVCKGSPGQVALTPDPVSFCIAQDMVALRANKELIDPGFLLVVLRSYSVQWQIQNMHVGTLIPHFKKGDFKNLFIRIPSDIKYQKKIADKYLAISYKIALNRRQNETLEAMAQALFKSWFVDFDPVIDNALAAGVALPEALHARAARRKAVLESGTYPRLDATVQALFPDRFEWSEELGKWVPGGWEVKSLADVIQLIGGGTPKTTIDEYWNGEIPWFSVVDAPKHSDVFVIQTEKHITELGLEKSSAKLLPKGTTIISARGTVGKCAMVSTPMTTNQSCYAIIGNDISDSLTYYYIRHNVADLQSRGHGSVFNTITRSTFESISVCEPPNQLDEAFDKIVSTYFLRIEESSKENLTLSSLRDLLLGELIG